MGSDIIAVLFDKSQYTLKTSRAKLKEMGLSPIKPVHTTAKYYRYRIQDPANYKRTRTKKTSQGLSLLLGFK